LTWKKSSLIAEKIDGIKIPFYRCFVDDGIGINFDDDMTFTSYYIITDPFKPTMFLTCKTPSSTAETIAGCKNIPLYMWHISGKIPGLGLVLLLYP